MDFPTLQTKRLDLIEIQDSHLDDLFKSFSDVEVTKYYNLLPYKDRSDGQRFIDWYRSRFEEGVAIRWGIALKGNSHIIGTLGFNNYTKHHKANIGYDLQRDYWNNGYVTEALKAIINFGFQKLKINRIEAEVMRGNFASEIVLNKLGFTKEGILREWMFWNDTYFDMIMFSILKKDYPIK